jgi:glycosyltransferase involved in cell wall biosynthesis
MKVADRKTTEQRPLLTLVTATYNRSAELSKLLEALRGDLRIHQGQIEYLISDNASPDNTREMVHRFMAENPDLPVHYYRQSRNLGMDRNVFYLLEEARGHYVWFIADDDEIAPGRLSKVLERLSGSDLPLLVVRADNIVEWETMGEDPLNGDRIFFPADPKAAAIVYASSFLATMIFRRDMLRGALDEGKKLFGTCYAPWATGLHAMNRSKEVGFENTLTILGNKNFSGPVRFGSYLVLIKGRLQTWDSLPEGPMKQNLRPFLARLSISGWRFAAGGNLEIATKPAAILKEYLWHLRKIGPPVYLALPFFLASLVLPIRMRRVIHSLIDQAMSYFYS